MNIVIRTDASVDLGTGHVMRCLTLADELRQHDATVHFICRKEPGNLIELIEKRGYKVHRLSPDIDLNTDQKLTQNILKNLSIFPDWLIIDNYNIDISWESSLRDFTKKIMVIDDLENKQHDCDILLNQNYGINENQYKGLVSEHCIRLIGPKNALLRPQFVKLRESLKDHNSKINRIFIFMGGADPTNETCKVLRAVEMLGKTDVSIDVVVGVSNSHQKEIENLVSHLSNATCYFNTQNMAELMTSAQLCIGAGGSTSWERCCVGLPSIVIIIAENQVQIAKSLEKSGAIINLGWWKKVKESNIKKAIKTLLEKPTVRKNMAVKSKMIVDGKGAVIVSERILKV